MSALCVPNPIRRFAYHNAQAQPISDLGIIIEIMWATLCVFKIPTAVFINQSKTQRSMTYYIVKLKREGQRGAGTGSA